METLIVGNPLDKNTDVGAINNKEQLSKIKAYLKMGKEDGITLYQTLGELPKKDISANLLYLLMPLKVAE